ncbi:MAG: RluA family pseudouridine synthase [Actinomycetota bacterium]|nr:RluA family pseudouridine synthase [Actinomycetota bacterium]
MTEPTGEGAVEFRAVPGRLDLVVARRLGLPRAEVQRAIAEGRVTVAGRSRPKSFALAGGEPVSVRLEGLGAVPAEGPPVPVRYEDPYLAVVAKPSGLPTHPTAGRRTGTLVNRLLGMGMALSQVAAPERPGIVHRLDAGTSGLLVVAKDDRTHELLAAMFAGHEVSRRYLALVRGEVEHERFAVDAPLARRGSRIVVLRGEGRRAETDLEVRERFGGQATLLEATPRTGRTHQIRVHLSAVGHPILGDARYGGGGDEARRLGLTRPFLHAWRISFIHPRTGDEVEVEEPLPEDLEEALRRVRAG